VFNFLKPKSNTMNVRKIDDNFAITGQITPEQVKAISDAGFKAIVCARPDNEEPGQPAFADVAREAEKHGLKVAHIPVSGMVGEGQIIRFHQAMEQMQRPVLGYCRSGMRAGSLYATLSK
jgi:uncharacterized protein (TIGR01244 family)